MRQPTLAGVLHVPRCDPLYVGIGEIYLKPRRLLGVLEFLVEVIDRSIHKPVQKFLLSFFVAALPHLSNIPVQCLVLSILSLDLKIVQSHLKLWYGSARIQMLACEECAQALGGSYGSYFFFLWRSKCGRDRVKLSDIRVFFFGEPVPGQLPEAYPWALRRGYASVQRKMKCVCMN